MLNRWISKRVNVVSLIIALVYWMLACFILYNMSLYALKDMSAPLFDLPKWLATFFMPGCFLGLLSIYFGSFALAIPLQLLNLYLVILVVRIIVVFFFALFGWKE